MVDKSRRAELLQQYATRAPPNGVFAVRNANTHSMKADVQERSLELA